ncbi:hypothetical protein K438DRAFT_1996910 [Mycena galopus ATCC 62051]|nr:hypothetical protein K438DRAFT_1996910 [Mycena galopus ATCC 62051]
MSPATSSSSHKITQEEDEINVALPPVSLGTPSSPTVPFTAHPVTDLQTRESSPSSLYILVIAPSSGATKNTSNCLSAASGLGVHSKPKLSSVHSASLSVVSEEKRHTSKRTPSEWPVNEVVDWLESKGFGEEKKRSQALKIELNVTAYGKCFRIANAIKDLRRPPSSSGHNW